MSESILTEPLQNLVEGMTLAEVVLTLWNDRTNAGVIMELCKISEIELESFVPRSLWVGHKNIKCRHCGGRGYFSREVKWSEDESHLHENPVGAAIAEGRAPTLEEVAAVIKGDSK